MVKWGHEFGGAGQQGNSSLALPASAEGAMMTAAGFGIPLVASPIHGGQLSTVIEGKRNKGKDKVKCISSADFQQVSCIVRQVNICASILMKNTKCVFGFFT